MKIELVQDLSFPRLRYCDYFELSTVSTGLMILLVSTPRVLL